MPDSGIVKYLVKLKFEVDGVVEKADLIGAIFGQTEGLFGPEMNLHELQKMWKVGRIEINLDSKNGRTSGEVLVPMSTDISTASLIAAAVESVDKVGPCSARFQLNAIEDVRASKRRSIVERAKTILKDWTSRTTSVGEELLKDVTESAKRAKLVSFSPDELPAGPGIYTSDTVYLVEGRADVINLLRAGIENVLGLEGTSVQQSVIDFAKRKKINAFLDGDRGGDLILKELNQVLRVERIYRAPPGKEVEDLTPVEILDILKGQPTPPVPSYEAPKVEYPPAFVEKIRELFPSLNGTLEATILDGQFNQSQRVPVSELVQRLESSQGAKCVIFDGIVTQRLVDVCARAGVNYLVGHRVGEIAKLPQELSISTFRDIGLE